MLDFDNSVEFAETAVPALMASFGGCGGRSVLSWGAKRLELGRTAGVNTAAGGWEFS
jgi:hypothetical protein